MDQRAGAAEPMVPAACPVSHACRKMNPVKLLLDNLPPSLRGQRDTLAR